MNLIDMNQGKPVQSTGRSKSYWVLGGRYWALAATVLILGFSAHDRVRAQHVLGDPVDVSQEFDKLENDYFVAARIVSFDAATGSGTLEWKRYTRRPTYSFMKVDKGLSPARQNEEFPTEYDANPVSKFSIEFVSPRTIRIRINTSPDALRNEPSLMLAGDPPKDGSWKVEQNEKTITYTSQYGSVTLIKDPWEIQIRDSSGKLLTNTQNKDALHSFASPLPFCFVRVRLFRGLTLDDPLKTRSPRYCAATGIFAGPPCGMISFGSVTACTCSIVASGAISFSTRPSGVTSIHASSVMM